MSVGNIHHDGNLVFYFSLEQPSSCSLGKLHVSTCKDTMPVVMVCRSWITHGDSKAGHCLFLRFICRCFCPPLNYSTDIIPFFKAMSDLRTSIKLSELIRISWAESSLLPQFVLYLMSKFSIASTVNDTIQYSLILANWHLHPVSCWVQWQIVYSSEYC